MKNQIRIKLKNKREKISYNEILNKSKKIKKRLWSLNIFKESQNILFYISYNNEVYTHEMIIQAIKLHKKIFTPIPNKKTRTMSLFKISKMNDLKIGSYGILEPEKKNKKKSVDSIDLIIVPGIAFDIHGNRIGHGLGYYDNLLKKAKNITKIGLAFELQIVDEISHEIHDIPVDIIITENRLINCIKTM